MVKSRCRAVNASSAQLQFSISDLVFLSQKSMEIYPWTPLEIKSGITGATYICKRPIRTASGC